MKKLNMDTLALSLNNSRKNNQEGYSVNKKNENNVRKNTAQKVIEVARSFFSQKNNTTSAQHHTEDEHATCIGIGGPGEVRGSYEVTE